MKKITFLMLVALVVMSARTKAQTQVYSEDFESFTIGELPSGWSQDLGDPGLVWTVEGAKAVHDEDNGDWESQAHGGEKSLFNVENWGADGPTEVIGITPEFDLGSFTQVSLTLYELRAWDNYWPEAKPEHTCYLVAKESGSEAWVEVAEMVANQANFQTWTEVNVDISELAGKTVSLGFKVTTHTYFWRIDDISITGLTTGITTPEHDHQVKLYPNPANDLLTLTIDENFKEANVTIFDIRGQQIQSLGRIQSSTATIDVSQLPAGLYFVNVQIDGIVSTQKIMKQ